MIKVVFFDFDGVLTLEGHGCVAICRALAEQYDLLYEKLEPVFHGYAKEMLLEPKRYEAIIDNLNQDISKNITVQDIHEAIKTAMPNSDMLALAQELRVNSHITSIITDNNVERIEVLRQSFSLNDFNPLIVSAEVGCGKWQDTKIFEIALAKAQVKPNEALFIDNTEGNLKFAAKLGIQTYWHNHNVNDVAAFKNRLVDLGVKIQ